MKFGLSNKSIQTIHDVFIKYPELEEAIIYGSRAKGNFKEGSDIDITLFGADLTFDILNKIASELDDSNSPYLFDISIFHKLNSPDLEEHIKRVGQTFYKKTV